MTTHLEEGLFLNFSVVTMLRTISSLLGPVPEGAPPPEKCEICCWGEEEEEEVKEE